MFTYHQVARYTNMFATGIGEEHETLKLGNKIDVVVLHHVQ